MIMAMQVQAQLYKAQENSRLRSEGKLDATDRHVRKATGVNVAEILFARKNKGVEAREERDAEEAAATEVSKE